MLASREGVGTDALEEGVDNAGSVAGALASGRKGFIANVVDGGLALED